MRFTPSIEIGNADDPPAVSQPSWIWWLAGVGVAGRTRWMISGAPMTLERARGATLWGS